MLFINIWYFLCMHINPLIKLKQWNFFFDLGLGIFDPENVDVALTENAETYFVTIILIVNLISHQPYLKCHHEENVLPLSHHNHFKLLNLMLLLSVLTTEFKLNSISCLFHIFNEAI